MNALGTKIVVQVEKKKTLINSTETEKTARGKVISVGKQVPPPDAGGPAVGDLVLFGGYSGASFKDEDGVEYLVLQEAELLVKL